MTGNTQNSLVLSLTGQLVGGLESLDPARAARHNSFFLSFQQTDGGFAGREGGSDLYYTSFAVRGLALLNALQGPHCEAIASYLKHEAGRQRYSLIDFVSWLYSAFAVQLVGGFPVFDGRIEVLADEACATLESFRSADGGYSRTHEGGSGSTYHTFLAVLCYELLDRTPPDSGGIVQFLLTRRRGDGGFVEIGPMKRSGTNPTAAAAMLLKRFGAIDQEVISGIASYIENIKGAEGGLRANTQIPFSDLLSTFTGLLITQELGLSDKIDPHACRRFVSQLEIGEGGFHGAFWDNESDPEYTFYGLGTLALLNNFGDLPA